MKVLVNIHLKNGVLDPQGKAVSHALDTLGFKKIGDVRIGKQIILDIDTDDKEEAIKIADEAAKELLANLVIENYTIEVK